MFNRDNFIGLARQLKVPSVGVFEKDYCIGCFIDGLTSIPLLGGNFIFKGGTALRKVYFPDWRYSEDMDFSVFPSFPQDELKNLLSECFKITYREHGIKLSLKSYHKPDGMVRARIQYIGPLNHPALLYLDVTYDEPIVLKPLKRRLIESFPSAPNPEILVYPLEEILAEKLCALMVRGKARDYYDVWRLLKEKRSRIDFSSVKEVFKRKCEHRALIYRGITQFIPSESIREAKPYWRRDLRSQVVGLPEFEKVIAELKNLFILVGF